MGQRGGSALKLSSEPKAPVQGSRCSWLYNRVVEPFTCLFPDILARSEASWDQRTGEDRSPVEPCGAKLGR